MIKNSLPLWLLALAAIPLAGCNESDDEKPTPEPDRVTQLDITVTGHSVQAPSGNVYLFYSEETDLNFALGEGDGTLSPLADVSREYFPVVRYQKDGQLHELHPVSPYGTMAAGGLDNVSSVRYSQVHFDLTQLSTEYGTVGKNSLVLVVIALQDARSRTWTLHPLQLRRDYVIHVALPDNPKPTYLSPSDQTGRWWQVEGDD